MHAKTERNIEIYLLKEGLDKVGGQITKDKATYRALSIKYDLSIPRLIIIINRERRKNLQSVV